MTRYRLLSTDFDGTLVSHPSDGRCLPEMGEFLQHFVTSGGIWVVNTGRSLEHTLEGLELFQAPVVPTFLIVNERHIHEHCDGKYGSWESWNRPCDEIHRRLWEQSAPLIARLRELAAATTDVHFIDHLGQPEGLISSDVEAMERFVALLDEARKKFPDFSYHRNAIYLRFAHRTFSKGTALRHLSRSLGISAAATAAAGDNLNDLSMLQSGIAAWQVCPGNAVPEVKARVRENGGFVSERTEAHGTLEGLLHLAGEKIIPPEKNKAAG